MMRPGFKSNNSWFLKNLLGNWEVDPIYTYESPEYFTVQSGVDSNLNGDSAPDRVILNSSGVTGTGSGVIGLTRTGATVQLAGTTNAQQAPIVAYVATNPNAQYIQAGPGAYANAGRNTEPVRPINNVDLSLVKHFTIRERLRIDLQGAALNLFNHPQFIPGSLNNTAPVNTFNPGQQSYVTVNSAQFNRPDLAFSSNPRTLQVVARFNW